MVFKWAVRVGQSLPTRFGLIGAAREMVLRICHRKFKVRFIVSIDDNEMRTNESAPGTPTCDAEQNLPSTRQLRASCGGQSCDTSVEELAHMFFPLGEGYGTPYHGPLGTWGPLDCDGGVSQSPKRGGPVPQNARTVNSSIRCARPQGRGIFEVRTLNGLLQPFLLDSASSFCCCTFSSNFCVAMMELLCSDLSGTTL